MTRRFQFSLRALLMWVFAVASISAFYSSPLLARRRAIRGLEEIGAEITYDYQWGRDGAWRPNARPPGSTWLKRLLGENYCASPVEVQLFTDRSMSPHRFTDEQAAHIAALTELTWLVLIDTRLTDAGLRHLTSLRKLERLDLEGTAVTDTGVKDLKRSLPHVQVFY
jgi:hypothetical protein